MFQLLNDILAFEDMLKLFKCQLEARNLTHFQYCAKVQQTSPIPYPCSKYVDFIMKLKDQYEERFAEVKKKLNLFRLVENPFAIKVEEVPGKFQMALLDLQNNSFLQAHFNSNERDLLSFYRLLEPSDFPEIRIVALRTFTVFGLTYICEQTFSLMKALESLERSSLTDRHLHVSLRACTTDFTPNIKKMAEKVQAQVSH